MNNWVLTRYDISQLEPTSNGDEIGCIENNSIYSYSSTSTLTVEGDEVIAPPSGNGRWTKARTYILFNHSHTMYTIGQVNTMLGRKADSKHEHRDNYCSQEYFNKITKGKARKSMIPTEESCMPAETPVLWLVPVAEDPTGSQDVGLWAKTDGTLWFNDGSGSKQITLNTYTP